MLLWVLWMNTLLLLYCTLIITYITWQLFLYIFTHNVSKRQDLVSFNMIIKHINVEYSTQLSVEIYKFCNRLELVGSRNGFKVALSFPIS